MQNKIIRAPGVKDLTGYPRSTMRLRILSGLFPKPVLLGARGVGWPEAEVLSVNAARIAGKSEDEIRELVIKLEAARKLPRKDQQIHNNILLDKHSIGGVSIDLNELPS